MLRESAPSDLRFFITPNGKGGGRADTFPAALNAYRLALQLMGIRWAYRGDR